MQQVKVFVIDKDGKSCLPTRSARARRLLRDGKAKLVTVVPFTIQLLRSINNPVGSFIIGLDDGAKKVGVSIVNDKTNEVVFKGQVELRQDVKRCMSKRRNYRRTRRLRKLRYRQPRFDNRSGSKITPSQRCRKESSLRFIKNMMKRINIIKVIVEEVSFNHAENKHGYWFSLVEIGKTFLRDQIKKLGLVYDSTFGYITKENRLKLGLSKLHSNDAISIVCKNNPTISSLEWIIKPKRTKDRGSKKYVEKSGFRHYDVVKSKHRNKGIVIGSILGFKTNQISLRTNFSNDFPVVYSKTKLLQRPSGLVYYY